jgi:hypothetical protein
VPIAMSSGATENAEVYHKLYRTLWNLSNMNVMVSNQSVLSTSPVGVSETKRISVPRCNSVVCPAESDLEDLTPLCAVARHGIPVPWREVIVKQVILD